MQHVRAIQQRVEEIRRNLEQLGGPAAGAGFAELFIQMWLPGREGAGTACGQASAGGGVGPAGAAASALWSVFGAPLGGGGGRVAAAGRLSLGREPAGAPRAGRGVGRGEAATGNRQVGGPPAEFARFVQEAARRWGVPAELIDAVIRVESAYNPRCVSRAGAMGLMQLMPATVRELGVGDPFDPAENIMAGTRHLLGYWQRFGRLDLALAAYNAGPGAVRRYGGIPPYRETRAYVPRVLELYRQGLEQRGIEVSAAELAGQTPEQARQLAAAGEAKLREVAQHWAGARPDGDAGQPQGARSRWAGSGSSLGQPPQGAARPVEAMEVRIRPSGGGEGHQPRGRAGGAVRGDAAEIGAEREGAGAQAARAEKPENSAGRADEPKAGRRGEVSEMGGVAAHGQLRSGEGRSDAGLRGAAPAGEARAPRSAEVDRAAHVAVTVEDGQGRRARIAAVEADGRVHAAVWVDSAGVARRVMAAEPAIRQALAEQSVSLGSFGVGYFAAGGGWDEQPPAAAAATTLAASEPAPGEDRKPKARGGRGRLWLVV